MAAPLLTLYWSNYYKHWFKVALRLQYSYMLQCPKLWYQLTLVDDLRFRTINYFHYQCHHLIFLFNICYTNIIIYPSVLPILFIFQYITAACQYYILKIPKWHSNVIQKYILHIYGKHLQININTYSNIIFPGIHRAYLFF